MKIDRVRGFRDQYPEDMEPRKVVFSVAERKAELFGYKKIDVPSLEYLDLYRIKSGEELVGQTFSFTDKGGREVTMIPEVTPSVIRMLTSRKDLPRPVKWYSFPKVWRYEEPQAGRLREHFQFNADIFGSNTAEADAEIIGLAASILDGLDLTENYEIRINDRKLFEEILRNMEISNIQSVFSIIDKFRKITVEEFLSELKKENINTERAEQILDLINESFDFSKLPDKVSRVVTNYQELQPIIDRLQYTENLIKAYTSARIVYDFSIVRGLSYYTGIVFEVYDTQGQLRSVLGGGRYDGLAKLMSDQDIPAVGFGMGDVVIELLLKRTGKWLLPEQKNWYYICVTSEEQRVRALEIANEIRSKGRTAITDVSRKSLSSQLKAAASEGCGFAVIIGPKEMSRSSVTLRDLTTGDQQEVKQEEFLKDLS